MSEHEESSEFIKTKPAGRRDLCMICEIALYKYTCPKCNEKTCGLACLRKHKSIGECNGIANPTEHVRKEDIDAKVVEKDFVFVK